MRECARILMISLTLCSFRLCLCLYFVRVSGILTDKQTGYGSTTSCTTTTSEGLSRFSALRESLLRICLLSFLAISFFLFVWLSFQATPSKPLFAVLFVVFESFHL